jgi:GT2 family glycosyltransferase
MNLELTYIVVLNWNAWADTIECLESLTRIKSDKYKIVVCDNASDDNSLYYLKLWADGFLDIISSSDSNLRCLSYPPVNKPIRYFDINNFQNFNLHDNDDKIIFIQTGKNLGYAGGNNIGISYALEQSDCKYVWILNNDTVVDPDSLSSMIDQIKKLPANTAVLGAKVLYYSEPELIQCKGGGRIYPYIGYTSIYGHKKRDDIAFEQPIEVEHIYGASLFVKKDVFKEIGYFDETYFMYREETDWCVKVRNSRYSLYYCPSCRIYHKDGISAKKKSVFQDYYFIRNNLFFITKNYPLSLFTAFTFVFFTTLIPKIMRLEIDRVMITLKAYLDFIRRKKGFQKLK